MFVSNKRVKFPGEVKLNNVKIKVVTEFKLLGVTLDNKLTFSKHVSNICLAINKRLFSIKRLFYLCRSVKIQFFKSFIMPYFDYCLSLSLKLYYFPKAILQKLANCYYRTLFKLFKFDFMGKDFNEINLFLENFNLFAFQHRVFYRTFLFSYKIHNYSFSPPSLKDKLKTNLNRDLVYDLRNKDNLIELGARNKFGQLTFGYVFPKLINNCCLLQISSLDFKNFKQYLNQNINLLYNKIVKNFSRFNLNYKNYIYKIT